MYFQVSVRRDGHRNTLCHLWSWWRQGCCLCRVSPINFVEALLTVLEVGEGVVEGMVEASVMSIVVVVVVNSEVVVVHDSCGAQPETVVTVRESTVIVKTLLVCVVVVDVMVEILMVVVSVTV